MVLRISAQTTLLRRFTLSKPCFHHHRRHRSSHSGRGQLIEVDLQAVASSDGEAEVIGVNKLEEMIHRITVLKSTPDWLPFLPGSSFWVPPQIGSRSPSDIAQMLVKMSNHSHNTLSNDESLSLTTFQGWPSSSFFQGGTIRHLSNVDREEEEEEDEDVELMFAAEEAEAIAEAEAEAIAEAEAEAIAEAEAEAIAEAEAEAKAKAIAEAEVEASVTIEAEAQVQTHSGKKSQFENEEG